MAARTTKKRGRPAKKNIVMEPMSMPEVRTVRRSAAKKPAISENTLFWLAIFFLLFAILAMMAYYKQVDDARQLIEFRQRQDEKLMMGQPTVSPSPSAKPAVRY